jgi:hypothetical protein
LKKYRPEKALNMVKAILALSAIVVLILSSCYYHKEDVLYPTICDTTNMTYSVNIVPLLNSYTCLSCHFGQNASGGIRLEIYDSIKTVAGNGRLLGAITHSPGYKPMPDGAPKMSPCDINKMKAWIAAGTPR